MLIPAKFLKNYFFIVNKVTNLNKKNLKKHTEGPYWGLWRYVYCLLCETPRRGDSVVGGGLLYSSLEFYDQKNPLSKSKIKIKNKKNLPGESRSCVYTHTYTYIFLRIAAAETHSFQYQSLLADYPE